MLCKETKVACTSDSEETRLDREENPDMRISDCSRHAAKSERDQRVASPKSPY